MIDSLSSFIELFAAVYLTISLDDLLLRRFWTPDYEKKMEASIKDVGMPEIAKQHVLKNAKNMSSIEETRSRKRGIIMFVLSVMLLILIGFEDGVCLSKANNEACGIMAAIILCDFVFSFDGFFLKTGWRLLLSSVAIPVLVIVGGLMLRKIDGVASFLDSSEDVWALLSKIAIVAALMIPVLWQLFRNWIYTRYYLLYIVEHTKEKTEEYRYAVGFDLNKGHKMTNVAKPYMDIVAETMVQKDQDRDISPFFDMFLSELTAIDYIPQVFPLLRHSYRMHRKYFPSKRRLKKLSKKYDSIDTKCKKPTLEAFCRDNNIDYALVREFRHVAE